MKPIYRLYVKGNCVPLDPVLYTVVEQNNTLAYRVEGRDSNYWDGGEYYLFNGDFSKAGQVYRIGGGSQSGVYIGGTRVVGAEMSYRVQLNRFNAEVRHKPDLTGGTFCKADSDLQIHALLAHLFWLYDGDKEIARMRRKWFHFFPTYVVDVYDERVDRDVIMGMFLGVLAVVGDHKDTESHIGGI